jgi:hypothetical protein
MSYSKLGTAPCSPRRLRNIVVDVSLLCIAINFIVKIGIIYGFEHKWILVAGSIIDAIGVTLVALLGRFHK